MTRIFVTGTGRCGTMTFAKAAGHATNFGVDFEPPRTSLDFPDRRITVAASLHLCLPLLVRYYPDAKWVHVVREREACIDSLATLSNGEMMRWWGWFYLNQPAMPARDAAAVYYDLTNALIAACVPYRFTLNLEHARSQWPGCWQFMGCDGDFNASLAEWSTKYNARRTT